MQIEVDDALSRYQAEIGRLTHRAIMAEARADAAEKAVEGTEKPATD